LLAKRGQGRQEDTTELAERGCPGFHITISGDVELTDGLNGPASALGTAGYLIREHFACGCFCVDRVVLASTGSGVRAGLVDLDYLAPGIGERAGETGRKMPRYVKRYVAREPFKLLEHPLDAQLGRPHTGALLRDAIGPLEVPGTNCSPAALDMLTLSFVALGDSANVVHGSQLEIDAQGTK
jgi:hypothetical protein